MPTFAQSAAARDAKWSVIWTIEGSGNYTGLYKYCTQLPDYAIGNSQYRPWAMDWPHILDEQADEFGGVPDSGEFSCSILDYEDSLTSEWRIEADPSTFLSGDLTSAATSLALDAYGSFTSGSSVAWLGNECLRVTAGSGPFTVTRGWLDTDAFPHYDGDPVYARQSYLHQRRVRVYLAPIDAASSAEETEFGVYSIDTVGLDESLGAWVLRAKAQAKWMSRVVFRKPAQKYEITHALSSANTIGARLTTESLDAGYSFGAQTWNGGVGFHIRVGDEIAIVSAMSTGNTLLMRHRAQLGSDMHDIQPDDVAEIVFAADPTIPPLESDAPTFFRWSDAPTPATTEAGSWTRSSHWIDIVLNLATSSADPADGLRFANRNSAYGAWDCLPIGIGIGVPHGLIDLKAALVIRALYQEQRFDDFYLPPEPVEFGELISESFLKVLGARLSISAGIAKIFLPRFPIAGSATIAIGTAEMLRRKVGKLVYMHDMTQPMLDNRQSSRSLLLKFKDRTITLLAENFGRSTKASRGYYATEEKSKEINIPHVRSDRHGLGDAIYEAARHHFMRNLQPRWDFGMKVDISQYDVAIGDLVAMSHEDLPDLASGARGWSSMTMEILRRVLRVNPEAGAVIDWGARAYGSGIRVGKIAPSARIVSVTDAAGTPDVTVSANRFTHTDGEDAELPITDAAAFAVNDVVRLRNRNGTTAGGTTQIITGIAGNVITLDGNFGGTLTNGTGNAGLTIKYATRANAVAQQYNFFVFFADQVAHTVGASTQTAWRFA